jgi:hypothetical protein
MTVIIFGAMLMGNLRMRRLATMAGSVLFPVEHADTNSVR